MNINLLKDLSEEDYEVGIDALPRLKSFIDSDILLNRLKEQYSITELASNSDTSSLPTAGYIFFIPICVLTKMKNDLGKEQLK